ncbi:MAG: hypothetical protein ABH837_01240, partial [bacterium]
MSELEPTPTENGSESEEEVEKRKNIEQAEFFLNQLREERAEGRFPEGQESCGCVWLYKRIREWLEATDADPEDIGATEEELDEIKNEVYKNEILYRFGDGKLNPNALAETRNLLKESGLDPKDIIGITEEELDELIKK